MSKQWDDDDTFGSDIIGSGSCWGNVTGKVKTREIGFVRSLPRKTSVPVKGRSKTSAPHNKQAKRK